MVKHKYVHAVDTLFAFDWAIHYLEGVGRTEDFTNLTYVLLTLLR